MVPKISSVKNLLAPLYYNERKVASGVAERIGAVNFLKDAEHLSLQEIRSHLLLIDGLNERSVKRALHLSLNFEPGEDLSNQKLLKIARRYMELIGYERQPFVVYRHQDAAHPHIHVVATLVNWEGQRVHGLSGRRLLEPVRRAVEREFSLLGARSQRQVLHQGPQRVVYGKSELRASLERVLGYVLEGYRFRSLDELNGVLRLYNLSAQPAPADSPGYRKGSVLYRALDERGRRIGRPVPASRLRLRADRAVLEAKFREGEGTDRESFRLSLKAKLDRAHFLSSDGNGYISTLGREGVHVVLGGQGSAIYVDHTTRQVFSARDLGEEYAGRALEALLRSERQEEDLAYGFREQRRKKKTLSKHL